MKIWVDCTFGLEFKTGVGMYILMLIECFDKLKLDYEKFSCKSIKHLKFKYYFYLLWANTFFYIETLIKKPDVIIFPTFYMPFLKRKGTKYFTVIHDLAFYSFPQTRGKYFLSVFKSATNIAIKKADMIITVSETIKKEIIERFNFPEDRIKIINNTVGEQFFNEPEESNVLKKFNVEAQAYIIAVATLNKHKNVISLVKAFETLSDKYPDIKLLLVGPKGNSEILTTNKNVIFTGYVQDEEIVSLYQNSLMSVFPSLYEGFGIPILEAQASKTPLICSDIPVFKEVAGEGALFCEPTPEKIAIRIEEIINTPNIKEQLVSKGLENIKRFHVNIIENQIKDVLGLS